MSFFGRKYIEMGPGMLYMVGQILLYIGVRFDIVYNESAHENITNVENLFFHRVNKISIFLNRGGCAWNSTVVSYTYIPISLCTFSVLRHNIRIIGHIEKCIGDNQFKLNK